MTHSDENLTDLLVIYEKEAEEWASYLKAVFEQIVEEGGILLYNLDLSSRQHLESMSLSSYQCKLLILSKGLLENLNREKRKFLVRLLHPPDTVVILLCGLENSDELYDLVPLDRGSREISTDQDPQEYFTAVIDAMQQGTTQRISPPTYSRTLMFTGDYPSAQENVYTDFPEACETNVLSNMSEETEDVTWGNKAAGETSETNKPSMLVLPKRISCENPGEIFILFKDEIIVDVKNIEVEFTTKHKQIRIQPNFWNEKVLNIKALDFPAGPVKVNVYCEGVIKTATEIEYYTAMGEIEHLLRKVADPMDFVCQAFKIYSIEKLDHILTNSLKSKMTPIKLTEILNEEVTCQQESTYSEELPTLLHCAAKFGLKNLISILTQCPGAIQASRLVNKYGEDPANLAARYGHKDLQKLIAELSLYAPSCEDEQRESTGENIYVTMNSTSTQQFASAPYAKEQENGEEAGKEETGGKEQQDREEEKEKEDEDKDEDSQYNTSGDDENVNSENQDETIELNAMEDPDMPPLPAPRAPALPLRREHVYCFSKAKEQASGDLEEYREGKHQIEEDPYSFTKINDDGIYDMILATANEEEKEECKSFIMNRPPAPAPRPISMPAKESNTPFIAQVFQQKAAKMQADNEKVYYAVHQSGHLRNDHHQTYATFGQDMPFGQDELILLQEKVKNGSMTMDEAVEKFKQWQNEKSGLDLIQQEKLRQLRGCIIGNRAEEEIVYDKITIVHHPNATVKKSRRASHSLDRNTYAMPHMLQPPPHRNPIEKDYGNF
ncbi:B-cell scaffold protein with ankyrin repeats isoform X2 [Rhinatrema bivittatum]|uniref:B-cell scaffold protein with ankyrin repeats isoform X2 n=1 Tax=Rhinatrema bivittatum TaxID=194408 RepID=UPI00112BA239|nr:B-cell scaffold protein with ankyrin repeats isoform X2 [Rhinatrema bivittatum]